MNYTDQQIEDLLKGIYAGRIIVSALPEDLYFAIADYLKKGLYKGFGGTLADFGGTDLELLQELRENVYMFSGAKTYQQIREMSAMVAESKTFNDFKKLARAKYNEYNDNWLNAEYNTAIGQAQNAKLWAEFEKDKKLFPYLKYNAVIDKNTSDICRPLNGIIRKVDDPLWSRYSPLNHFNCRCLLEKIDKYEETNITPKYRVDAVMKELEPIVENEFKMNPGKDGYIFSPKHPYFEVDKKDKALARNNFNLPIPKKD